MKTFNEKDLITWANREKAVIGNEYYFADSITDMQININSTFFVKELDSINENNLRAPFGYSEKDINYNHACLLPVDAVKEQEKKYRACKTIKEFYELVFNTKSKDEKRFYIDELLGTPIYFRGKYQNEFYTILTQINIIDGKYLIVLNGAMFSFNELFNNYEIEVNGEWLPFGVKDNEKE